ncbi:MAG: glycerol-3-phosphate acyltransferase [Oscillospiraceae bacterium]|nr:glycerol-3-phosphate acyltransferase [Oscillospiraceae bacterium]
MWLFVMITVVAGYLLGNLNGAVLVSHLMGDDVRSHGSGNAGLTNFIRNYGAGRALTVILVDAEKAIAACVIGGLLLKPSLGFQAGSALGGAAVILGHVCPVFLGFKGGKGILSGLFVALMTDWRVAVIILAVFAIAYFSTQYVSLGSVLAAAAFALSFVILHFNRPVVMLCGVFTGALAIWMHRPNVIRLLNGQERKTNLFKKDKA